MNAIHISTARAILNAPEPVDVSFFKSDGSAVTMRRCVSLRYDFRGGYRNLKSLESGAIRRVRDVCIFAVNGLEVFL